MSTELRSFQLKAVNTHLGLSGLLSEILVVRRPPRSGLGDAAMVRKTSHRVNYEEGPYPAKWSPIRPCIRLAEGSSTHEVLVETEENPPPSVVTPSVL